MTEPQTPLPPAVDAVGASEPVRGTSVYPDAVQTLTGETVHSTIPGLSNRSGRFVCPPCGSRWDGQAVAHCATCHETFGRYSGFDKHRVGKFDSTSDPRRCARPTDVGMVVGSRGVWGTPADVDFAEVFATPQTAS